MLKISARIRRLLEKICVRELLHAKSPSFDLFQLNMYSLSNRDNIHIDVYLKTKLIAYIVDSSSGIHCTSFERSRAKQYMYIKPPLKGLQNHSSI